MVLLSVCAGSLISVYFRHAQKQLGAISVRCREVEIEMSKGVKMWFGYTLSEDGVWEAVCYRTNFGNPPLEDSLRTELVEVPADCIGADGEPIFAELRDRFPLEVEE